MLTLFDLDPQQHMYACTLLDLIDDESEPAMTETTPRTAAPAIDDFSPAAEQWRYENGQRVLNPGKVLRKFDTSNNNNDDGRCLMWHGTYGDDHDETNAHGKCRCCGAPEMDYAPAPAAPVDGRAGLEIVAHDGIGGGPCVLCHGMCDFRWVLTRRNGTTLDVCSECSTAVSADPEMVPPATLGHLTFAVVHTDGTVSVRSSKTMCYVQALVRTDAKGPGVWSWHQSRDASTKAFGTALRQRADMGEWQVYPVRAYPYGSQRAQELRAANTDRLHNK